MTRIPAASDTANTAFALVGGLQQRFVAGLTALARDRGAAQGFSEVAWLRDEGRHGGGVRFETADGPLFGRGSVNVSQVHYDDMPDKRLGSANAISTIIHPVHPLAPSVHIHVSWTEMKDGTGYWRIMADLNPSHENPAHTERFLAALKAAAPAQFDAAKAQGERYFYIPVLGRHRGVAHFYLEGYHTDDAAADLALATACRRRDVPTLPAVVESMLDPAEEAARAVRTDRATLLEDGRDVALELRRLVHGDLCGMFDGPTTEGLDLAAPLVVLDLSALYDPPALGILMACATAWLQAALARQAAARLAGAANGSVGSGHVLVVVDEAWAVLANVRVQ